ncbi:hypothetical protein [Mesorhizobium sp.]|uniref:hypothetical protein n=1 Tax=Mesorhizobium sp. TaxID=1871066 RepID=UPI003BAC719D
MTFATTSPVSSLTLEYGGNVASSRFWVGACAEKKGPVLFGTGQRLEVCFSAALLQGGSD